MMGIKERNFRPLPNLSLEELVPQDNSYRHLERTLDLSFVRELVNDCYAAGGRPSVDPVVFFKLQLVLFFEGLRSERQLMTVVADRLSILGVLVAPFEVTENKPMLDMLWRSAFRWKSRPRRVTGDSAYGTVENIAAIEKAGIRAYMALKGAGQGRPFFGKDEFAYDPKRDLYTCPSGELLMPRTRNVARSLIGYRAKPATCDTCELRPDCTTSKLGRQILRYFDEEYVDRVKGYRGTFPYEKALRKRRVWVEPLFAEAKNWHGLRRFRLRRLEKVNIEVLLIAAGQNIKRLVAARDRGPQKLAQMAALRPPDRVSRCRPHLTGGFSYFRRDKGVFQQPGKLRLLLEIYGVERVAPLASKSVRVL